MFHKTILAVYRDIARPCPHDAALVRLQSIRECLAKRSEDPVVADLLWHTISLELEMKKRVVRDQYLELNLATAWRRMCTLHLRLSPSQNYFKSTPNGQDAASNTVRSHVSLVQAELLKEMAEEQAAKDLAKQAISLYKEAGCEVGCLNVQAFETANN
ncbi:hypothetical protein DL765_004655 [Monosporascus sp. GIB2]|nr:hypothetical protein DL765_004655 [Monosporascus sp. GIB2]